MGGHVCLVTSMAARRPTRRARRWRPVSREVYASALEQRETEVVAIRVAECFNSKCSPPRPAWQSQEVSAAAKREDEAPQCDAESSLRALRPRYALHNESTTIDCPLLLLRVRQRSFQKRSAQHCARWRQVRVAWSACP